MKNTRVDLRSRKVYDTLIEAFVELLSEKTFDSITVVELCEKARTRTATFYNHFSDKYDFFAFMIAEKRRDFMIKTDWDCFEECCIAFVENSFAFIEAHRKMVKNILSDNLLIVMMNSISQEMSEQLKNLLDKEITDREANTDILVQMIIGAMSHAIRYWMEHNREISKKEVLEEVSALLRDICK